MIPDSEKSGIHATTVQLSGKGVVIIGVSGAGKTETALTLVERAQLRGMDAALVADDRTLLRAENNRLIASAPPALAGGVEIRGAGLFQRPYAESTPVDLVVTLVESSKAERYPSGSLWDYEGIFVPRLLLPALSANGDSNALSRAIEATLFYKPWPVEQD